MKNLKDKPADSLVSISTPAKGYAVLPGITVKPGTLEEDFIAELDSFRIQIPDLPLDEMLPPEPHLPDVGLPELNPQSGNASQSIMTMGSTQAQNVKFSDQKRDHLVDFSGDLDETRTSQDTEDASLANFFSRPLKIADIEWGTATVASADLNPWDLYFDNPRVTNRISNYNLLRCKLHIKIIVNGNSFLFGRAAAMYQPLAGVDALTNKSSLIDENFVSLSQMPKVFINPTESTGGEMCIPFFWPKNYLNVPNSDWDSMGNLLIKTINPLKHANGSSESVTISVFAWAEDVHLSVLTSLDTDAISPQSGEIDEANKEGTISGPATRVAHVANSLSSVPMLAPYAIATENFANMTAKFAKLLGYSRPNVTADAHPYKPTMISALATTTTPDGATKLTVDDKQELSIDPRIAGLNASDPLDILTIAKRESYLTNFEWATADAPETLLWNARVDPCLWAEVGSPTAYYFPATCHTSLPFQYWTGTMNFRFQVVASAFHRGRLKIVYDPNYVSSNEYNTNYLEIVDITEKSDFTISIGNGQEYTWLQHLEPGFDSVTNAYSTTPYAAKGRGNGVIAVYVVNELTTPNSVPNNDIEINVYISMGDDYEVAVPYDHFQKFVLKPQSGEIDELNHTDEPFQEESSDLGPTMDPLNKISCVYMGESIKSFRTILKRYTLHETIGTSSGSYVILAGTRNMYPYARGNVLDAVHLANTTDPYNFCNTLLFHWVTCAHSGFRGSMRYKIMPKGVQDVAVPSIGQVERTDLPNTASHYSFSNLNAVSYTTVSAAARSVIAGDKTVDPALRQSLVGANGLHRISSAINPNLEFEVPFYSNFRFVPGKVQNFTGRFDILGMLTNAWSYRWFHDGQNNSLFEIHAACGEDFTPLFFTGMPPMYFENTPPPL